MVDTGLPTCLYIILLIRIGTEARRISEKSALCTSKKAWDQTNMELEKQPDILSGGVFWGFYVVSVGLSGTIELLPPKADCPSPVGFPPKKAQGLSKGGGCYLFE